MKDNAISLEDLWVLVKRLNGDAQRCLTALHETSEDDEEGQAFWRRMYARAIFALIDGATYRMTFHAYAARGRPGISFTPEELSALEGSYDFDEDLEPLAPFGTTRSLEQLRFAFEMFARVHGSPYLLPIHHQEWGLIKEIAIIRQGLLFCREPREIEVYDQSVNELLFGSKWLIERMLDLLESCLESMLEIASDSDKETPEIIM
jgi:hypothetical protein